MFSASHSTASVVSSSIIRIDIHHFTDAHAKAVLAKVLIQYAKKHNNQYYFPKGEIELEYTSEKLIKRPLPFSKKHHNQYYFPNDKREYESFQHIKQKFLFSNAILMTPKERDPSKFCINFIENEKLNEGGEAEIYAINWKAELDKDQTSLIAKPCKRILKDLYVKPNSIPKEKKVSELLMKQYVEEHTLNNIRKSQLEYEFAKATKLRPKKPVATTINQQPHFLLVEAYIPDEDLFDVIYADLDCINQNKLGISMQQRLKLAREICKRYLELSELGIVHRDPSRDNIRCENNRGLYQVKLTDFSMAKKASENDFGIPAMGSYATVAPETLDRKGSSFESDKYSMTKIIRELFRPCEFEDYSEPTALDIANLTKFAKTGELYDLLFDQFDSILISRSLRIEVPPSSQVEITPEEFIEYLRSKYRKNRNTISSNEDFIKQRYSIIVARRKKIINCLKGLAAYEPKNRIPYRDAIEIFKALEWEVTYEELVTEFPNLSSEFDKAYQSANAVIKFVEAFRPNLKNYPGLDYQKIFENLYHNLIAEAKSIKDHPAIIQLFVRTLECDALLSLQTQKELLHAITTIFVNYQKTVTAFQPLKTTRRAIEEINKVFDRLLEYPFFTLNDLIIITAKFKKDYEVYCSRFSIFDPKPKPTSTETHHQPVQELTKK